MVRLNFVSVNVIENVFFVKNALADFVPERLLFPNVCCSSLVVDTEFLKLYLQTGAC